MNKNIIILVIAIIAVGGYVITSDKFSESTGQAPSGLPAVQRTATTTEVGPQEVVTIFTAKNYCSSRIISTTDGLGQAIQVIFGDPTNEDVSSTTISEVVGHLQAGSTTAAYDSGIYGCGRWTVDAPASTTLLISEFN